MAQEKRLVMLDTPRTFARRHLGPEDNRVYGKTRARLGGAKRYRNREQRRDRLALAQVDALLRRDVLHGHALLVQRQEKLFDTHVRLGRFVRETHAQFRVWRDANLEPVTAFVLAPASARGGDCRAARDERVYDSVSHQPEHRLLRARHPQHGRVVVQFRGPGVFRTRHRELRRGARVETKRGVDGRVVTQRRVNRRRRPDASVAETQRAFDDAHLRRDRVDAHRQTHGLTSAHVDHQVRPVLSLARVHVQHVDVEDAAGGNAPAFRVSRHARRGNHRDVLEPRLVSVVHREHGIVRAGVPQRHDAPRGETGGHASELQKLLREPERGRAALADAPQRPRRRVAGDEHLERPFVFPARLGGRPRHRDVRRRAPGHLPLCRVHVERAPGRHVPREPRGVAVGVGDANRLRHRKRRVVVRVKRKPFRLAVQVQRRGDDLRDDVEREQRARVVVHGVSHRLLERRAVLVAVQRLELDREVRGVPGGNDARLRRRAAAKAHHAALVGGLARHKLGDGRKARGGLGNHGRAPPQLEARGDRLIGAVGEGEVLHVRRSAGDGSEIEPRRPGGEFRNLRRNQDARALASLRRGRGLRGVLRARPATRGGGLRLDRLLRPVPRAQVRKRNLRAPGFATGPRLARGVRALGAGGVRGDIRVDPQRLVRAGKRGAEVARGFRSRAGDGPGPKRVAAEKFWFL
mmetsp:Transcript_12463/g.52230  ORF Transcript_12463/g.52230 Transcript_12463/m.52230 type:complete len:692 (+) Transcript_12463:1575-3650(+)